LLRGLGAGVTSLPFLPRLLAAQSSAPKRLVFYFTPNECIQPEYWKPAGSGEQYALPASLPEIMKPLEPFRAKLTVVGGMVMRTREKDNPSEGHVGISHTITGWARPLVAERTWKGNGGPSVDHVVAQRLGCEVMYLATSPGQPDGPGCISFRGKNQPTSAILDPNQALDRYFAAVNQTPEEGNRLRDRRMSVLDSVARELTSLSGRLSGEDRTKLDLHLSSVRDIEQRLREYDGSGPVRGVGCVAPERKSFDHLSNGWVPETTRLHIDIIVQALACNLTQVATVQIGGSGGQDITARWPRDNIMLTRNAHRTAHDLFGEPHYIGERVALEQWFFRQYAYLLAKMDEVHEGDGTMLDNSVVVFVKNLGKRHNGYPMVYTVAGGAAGALRGGYYVHSQKNHNDLLASLCQLMGLGDVVEFGDPDFATAPLTLPS
jgi:hypothetical protein